jgi:serine/threonine protein kinase
MDKNDVIKQIGKGSFSNVYLCKRQLINSSLLILSGIWNGNDEYENYVIKEINLDNLVKKYIKKIRIKSINIPVDVIRGDVIGTTSVSITPYNNNKKLSHQLDSEEEYYYKRLRDLINSEIDILNKLSHKNIIKFLSSEKKEYIYYIKMEYCIYGDLYSILKNTKSNDFKLRNIFDGFEMSFIKAFLRDTVNAIEYIHNLNIIHRDIKLHNFLVTKDERSQFLFKLSDFGFACFDLECKLNDSLNISDIDFSSSILKKKYYKLCGTPYYMAPEIILNIEEFEQILISKEESLGSLRVKKFYDKKVDLWSYGICLYELIFNMLPFSDVYDIIDLKDLFSNSRTQGVLNNTINKKNILESIKKILINLLIINPSCRISTKELVKMVKELNVQTHEPLMKDIELINEGTSNILDIINCQENVYQKNEIMKENIINVPVDLNSIKGTDESWVINSIDMNSWMKINKASSLITKLSVDNNFMKWLINKK